MQIRIPDPWRYHEFADRIANNPEQGLEVADRLIATTVAALDSHRSPLPDEPDHAAAEDWLIRVRAHHYTPGA